MTLRDGREHRFTLPALKRLAQWKNDAQFNFGSPTLSDVEVVGTGDSAYLRLAKTAANENVPYTIPGNYNYDPAKIEVVGGVAKLKGAVTNDNNWPFTIPGNYIYDPTKIEVTGGVAQLLGSPSPTHAWYHLNSGSGAIAVDSSGNGRDGALIAMEDADWVPGKLNNCLRFNEGGTTDEYINCGSSTGNFELNDSFTVEFWIKLLSWPAGNNRVVYKYNGSNGYLVYVGSSRVNLFFLDKIMPGYLRVHGSTPISLDTWYHVVVAYDGSSVAAGVTMHVNGNKETITVVQDSIAGGSIVNPSPLNLCGTTLSYFLDGYLDEVVIYDRELSDAEAVERYNSGAGTENPLGSYPTDDPTIIPTAGWVFSVPINIFTPTATIPAGSGLRYQISSDDGATWKWWSGAAWVAITGGQTDSWYYVNESNTGTDVHLHISALAGSGTFKCCAFLHSDDGGYRPELDNVYVAEGVSFPIGSFEIEMDYDLQPAGVGTWDVALETVVKPVSTEILYQYSTDVGGSWNSVWLTEAQLTIALQTIVTVGDGTDTLRFKVQLSTINASVTPQLDNIQIDYSFRALSGYYESTKYQPGLFGVGALYADVVALDLNVPSGTSMQVEVRVIDHALEEGYRVVNDGDHLDAVGPLIQWKATFAGTAHTSPRVNGVEVEFGTGS